MCRRSLALVGWLLALILILIIKSKLSYNYYASYLPVTNNTLFGVTYRKTNIPVFQCLQAVKVHDLSGASEVHQLSVLADLTA